MCNIGKGLRFLLGLWVVHSVSEPRLARDWTPDWCSASVLWESVEGPFSQGGFGAVHSRDRDKDNIASGYFCCCSSMGEGEDSERARAGLFETSVLCPSVLPQQLSDSFPKFGWILPIVK